MKMKKNPIGLILALLISTLLLFGCSTDTSPSESKDTTVGEETTVSDTTTTNGESESSATVDETTTTSGTEVMSFTKDELAKYDGKNGNPAYIAVDGIVYDVSDESQWSTGTHAEKYNAGQDLTSEFDTKSPHSSSIFDGVPVVGVYTG